MWCFHHDFEKGIVGSWFSKINQRLGFWKLYHPAILALTSYPFKPIIFIRFFSIHCQAQLQFHLKLSWVRSIITVPDPSGWPANHPEKYQNSFLKQNLLCKTCNTRSFTDSIWKMTYIFSPKGRRPHIFSKWKTTLTFVVGVIINI